MADPDLELGRMGGGGAGLGEEEVRIFWLVLPAENHNTQSRVLFGAKKLGCMVNL